MGAISAQFAEAIVKSVVQQNRPERQEIVKSYQTTHMKPKTFISEMLRHDGSIDQIVSVLVEEQCDLLEGKPCFEAQVNTDGCIWGKRSARTNVLNKKEGQKILKFFKENDPSTLNVPHNLLEEHTLVAVKQKGEFISTKTKTTSGTMQ